MSYDDWLDDARAEAREENERARQERDFIFGGPEFHEDWMDSDDYPDPLYWSNEDGWVKFSGATRFSQEEKEAFDLPFDGGWSRVAMARGSTAPQEWVVVYVPEEDEDE